MRHHPLLLLLLLFPSLVSPVFLDLDAQQTHSVLDGGRWRCTTSDLQVALADALGTNYSALGWLEAFVAPVASNLTGCEELFLTDLGAAHESLPPLAAALKAACADADRAKAMGLTRRQLGRLDLEGSELGDAGLGILAPAMGGCGSLTHLFLPANRVGDAGARALASSLLGPPPHASLRVLDLGSNRIGDDGAAGLQALLRLPAPEHTPVPLLELRLSENRIGPDGMRLIGDALRDNVQLSTLMLSGNPLGDEGGHALARALVSRKPGRPSALRRLYLGGTDLGDAGGLALLHALEQPHAPTLEVLVLEGNPRLSAAARRKLEGMAPWVVAQQPGAASSGSSSGGGGGGVEGAPAGAVILGAPASASSGVFVVAAAEGLAASAAYPN